MASLSRTTSQESHQSSASSQSLSAAAEGAAKGASSVEAAPTASSTRPVGPPRSRTSSHTLLHSSLSSHVSSRKSRFADAGTTEGNSGRASISMPPPHKPAVISRQASAGSTMNVGLGKGVIRSSSGSTSSILDRPAVIEDHDKTPNIQSFPASEPSSPLPPDSNLKLPPSALATADVEGNRSSFTSLYSLGSAIYQGTIGSHSAPPSAASSNAGSVKSGSFDPTSTPLSPTRSSFRSDLSAPTTTATDPVLVTANTHTQLQGLQVAFYFSLRLIDVFLCSSTSQYQGWQV